MSDGDFFAPFINEILSELTIAIDVVLDGTVISVHFAFSVQRKGPDEVNNPGGGLYHTDLLERYKAYAEEMVCPFPQRGHAIGNKASFWRS